MKRFLASFPPLIRLSLAIAVGLLLASALIWSLMAGLTVAADARLRRELPAGNFSMPVHPADSLVQPSTVKPDGLPPTPRR